MQNLCKYYQKYYPIPKTIHEKGNPRWLKLKPRVKTARYKQ